MGLRIIYGKAGTGKTSFCFDEISNIIENQKNIYVITPEQFSFSAEKQLMSTIKTKAVINAEVITLSRIAYRVLNEVGGLSRSNLSKSGKAMLIYSILSEQKKNLKFLGKSDENVDLAITAITEFKKHGITPELLKEEISNISDVYLKTKLTDINLIYNEFENKMSGNYVDDTDLLTLLSEKIEETKMFDDSIIYIDEFMGFTSQEYEIIKKLIKIAKQVTITVCTDSLITDTNPDTDIFYSNKLTISKILNLLEDDEKIEEVYLDKTKRFKNEELKALELNLYKNKFTIYDQKVDNIALFLAKNPYSEIENVAKTITKLIRDKNYRYKDISIITKNIDNYSSLIRAIFDKYQIPVFIDEKRELNQNIIVQYILTILEIFNRNWSYEAVFNYIKTGFLKIEEETIFKLEKYCIKWGIKQNKWKDDFKYGITKDNKQEIESLNEVRKQIVNPLIELKSKLEKEKTVKNIVKTLYNFILEQQIEEKIKEKVEFLEEKELIDLAKEYISSYEIIINLFDEIVAIFGESKMAFDKFVQILQVGLKNSGLGKIPQTADQVIVGDVERSRSHKVKVQFIIGVNDGSFPSINRDEGFLNDSDREFLKNDGIELAKGTIDNLYEENFNIYKAFTTAEEKLYISYVSTDSQGKSLRASNLINKIKKIFANLQEESDVIEKSTELLNVDTTYDELLENIRDLYDGKEIDDVWKSVYKYYANDNEFSEKLKNNLKGLAYSNLPERISYGNIEKLYGNTLYTSVSKLEQYRRCPFSYYLKYGLKIKENEQLKVQSMDTGTFMHETIDDFFKIVQDENKDIKELTDEEIKEIIEQIIEEKLSETKNYIFVSSKKYKLLVARLKRIITKALKYIIEGLVKSEFSILGTELEFATNEKYKPIVLNLENGKKVEITGKIDRIDTATNDDGSYLRIIDYKSSAKDIDLNEVYAGLQLQLLTYMDAVCKVEDLMPAGVLYFGLLEQMVKANKKMTDEELEEKIKSNFKMKGLILADVKVVRLHDKTLTSKDSKLVPAYIDSTGNLSYKKTSGVTKEQFEDLQKYINKTIKEISTEIFSGNIDLKPYYKNKKTPCEYCDYKAICGFNPSFADNKYNYINKKSKEEILEKIKE